MYLGVPSSPMFFNLHAEDFQLIHLTVQWTAFPLCLKARLRCNISTSGLLISHLLLLHNFPSLRGGNCPPAIWVKKSLNPPEHFSDSGFTPISSVPPSDTIFRLSICMHTFAAVLCHHLLLGWLQPPVTNLSGSISAYLQAGHQGPAKGLLLECDLEDGVTLLPDFPSCSCAYWLILTGKVRMFTVTSPQQGPVWILPPPQPIPFTLQPHVFPQFLLFHTRPSGLDNLPLICWTGSYPRTFALTDPSVQNIYVWDVCTVCFLTFFSSSFKCHQTVVPPWSSWLRPLESHVLTPKCSVLSCSL